MTCFTENGTRVLLDRYCLQGETVDQLIDRVAKAYSSSEEHYKSMKHYISTGMFMPATPILSNGGTERGLPISCFLNRIDDSFFDNDKDPNVFSGIADIWHENAALAKNGGGIGTDYSYLREIDAPVKHNGKSSGIIPFIKVQDIMTLAVSQGDLRRGSSAVFLEIDHPEIEEFIDIRRPEGDPRRRCLDVHHGVIITDKFMEAVINNQDFELISRKTNKPVRSVPAKELWARLMTARLETGEPYMIFKDNMQKATPVHHKYLNLYPTQSNLCTEITLPTCLGRTAVCCLGSINLETTVEILSPEVIYPSIITAGYQFIEDCLRFLDNVLSDFIKRAPKQMARAVESAFNERSVGLGFMGYFSLLQKNKIPLESELANKINIQIFAEHSKLIQSANENLGKELRNCEDYDLYLLHNKDEPVKYKRFSYACAIAPTANISIFAGECSPGIEPYAANTYTQDTLSGKLFLKNKHLEKLLIAKGQNTEAIWKSILDAEGSVQHLSFLSDNEKDVFKTAYEIDQNVLIKHAADRAPYIDQGQSVNLFIDVSRYSKKDFSAFHIDAWKGGVKSLYYCRSKAVGRAEKITCSIENKECLSCQ